jgi:phosphoribosylanthranilate isomerase
MSSFTTLSKSPLRVKICGITQPEQGQAIAALGADALGFICVHQSPRYVDADQIQQIQQTLPAHVARIGVFMDAPIDWIAQIVEVAGLTGVQLHGSESVADCHALRDRLPQIEIIKAFRVRQAGELATTTAYTPVVDWLLLDAYHPGMGGGTGKTLDWQTLQAFRPERPWFLAGGLHPANITEALSLIQPNGIDLSSRVEIAPGNKDLAAIAHLFNTLRQVV